MTEKALKALVRQLRKDNDRLVAANLKYGHIVKNTGPVFETRVLTVCFSDNAAGKDAEEARQTSQRREEAPGAAVLPVR